MEHALMGYSGRPLIHPQSLPLGQNDSILSDCFKSILGAIMSIKVSKMKIFRHFHFYFFF